MAHVAVLAHCHLCPDPSRKEHLAVQALKSHSRSSASDQPVAGNRACISLRWENAPGLWPQNDLSSANTASRSQEDARLWRKQHGLLRTRSGMGREDDEYTHGRSNVNNIELPQMLQILRVVGFRVQTHQGVRGGVSELRS